MPAYATVPLAPGPSGGPLLTDVPAGGGPATISVQATDADAALPAGVGITNTLQIDLLP